MNITITDTPNPNAKKFDLKFQVTPYPISFSTLEDAKVSFLAYKILCIEGINSIFFNSTFITVAKKEHSIWDVLKPEIAILITDHYNSGMEALDCIDRSLVNKKHDDTISKEIEQQIKEVIDTKIRPSVSVDGGDITYCGFEDGIVKVQLQGACVGCSGSLVTLKRGIESVLKYYIPEVKEVQSIT